MQRGDRLGHALALGLDVGEWAKRNPRTLMQRWERLLDLSWMLDATRTLDVEVSATWRSKADEELQVLARELDPTESSSPGTVWRKLGSLQEEHLRRPDQATHLCRLLEGYLTRRTGLDGLRPLTDVAVEVTTSDADVKVLSALQTRIARLVRRWQAVIEVNPTSNLLIAGLDQPLDQPMFGLAPIENGDDPLPVVISTDDPAVFATRVADELAYAWAGLVEGGVAPSRARAWIEESCRNSLRASFRSEEPSREYGRSARPPGGA